MPASSNVVEFTITFASAERGSCGKTCRRACWLNLEAHPAQDESEVSLRICSRDMSSHLLCKGAVATALCRRELLSHACASTQQGGYRSLSGEDRNRTYLGPGYAEPTTVLKTART